MHGRVISFFALVCILGIDCAGLMGPADINVKYLKKCELEHDGFQFEAKQSVISRGKHVLSFNVTSPVKLSDEMAAKISVSVKTNGGWKPNFYNIEVPNLCSTMKTFEPNLLKEMANLKKVEPKCPLPKGRYEITNYPLLISDQGHTYPYGDFKIRYSVMLKQKHMCCVDAFVDSVPKRMRKG